ncbi:DNA-directed RNA polymerase subunit beta' [Microgenomates group bacterium]|nr:DNA-directed RNA polymerase subunit beta' [Microgenomates group bacterium]
MKHLIDFTALQIKLASPEKILEWSYGEVRKPETINYRSQKTEKDGLFDEKIFGPTKDYECYCGKYKRIRYKGIICDKCGVEVTQSRVRRERMGHIGLASPIAHIWFFKGAPSKLSLLLDIGPKNINSIVYFSQYLVLAVDEEKKTAVLADLDDKVKEELESMKAAAEEGIVEIKKQLKEEQAGLREKVQSSETLELKLNELETKSKSQIAAIKQDLVIGMEQKQEIFAAIGRIIKRLQKGGTLSEEEYLKLDEYDATDFMEVGMGAESLMRLAKEVDLAKLADRLRTEMAESTGAKKVKAIKRLKVVEGFKKQNIDPSWMFLTILPIIPPDLRPMVQLSGGKFATSDLNDLYRRVIGRNNRLKYLIELGAPEIILRNEKRMLQEAVDSLIDANQVKKATPRQARRPLKSLSEMLKGKQGRFRQNLLGKRVDYSGRSVIVVGPELKLNECGLPKDMALEMFKPYVLHDLIEQGIVPNVKSARKMVDTADPIVYDILEKVTKDHPVILNRAPTLHKLSIQAFYPILIEGSAIRLHPCVCSGFNADFDGDQMAVHVPLTVQAREECRDKMMSQVNLLKPANGEPFTIPNKEMAMGLFYYTSIDEKLPIYPSIFANEGEAYYAAGVKNIALRQRIRVRLDGEVIETTLGRIDFNKVLPEGISFINESVNAKKIKEVVTEAIGRCSAEVVAKLIDGIKDLGFSAATISGLSVSVADCKTIKEKEEIIRSANKQVSQIQDRYLDGFITEDERRKLTFDVWIKTTEEVANRTWDSYAEDNAVKVMINSGGTRASRDQVKQLAAMRGLVVDPLGNIVEMPTKSNFRGGLTIFEYVTSARGSRKGLTDSALKTADAGYLTRRLVDVAHDCIVRESDCGTSEHIVLNRESRPDVFANRILGRTVAEDIALEKEVIKVGEVIDYEMADKIAASKINEVSVYSPLTCRASHGLCAKCYGWDFATREKVQLGTPVGIIAAQSIGEPGTQLTMRVKHSGGILGVDVTQGLPRVEELLEVRKPKVTAVLAEVSGKVRVTTEGDGAMITITDKNVVDGTQEVSVNNTAVILVKDGDEVVVGEELTAGSVNLQDLLRLKGLSVTQKYIIDQVQAVYESQGIPIHDKHFEVIARKMGDKVQIENAGDTEMMTGEVVELSRFLTQNDATIAAGGDPATAKVLLLGITRSSLFTSSWLSAASFQHTKNVLTDSAAAGQVDYLEGLKENVIIGRLIPTNMPAVDVL